MIEPQTYPQPQQTDQAGKKQQQKKGIRVFIMGTAYYRMVKEHYIAPQNPKIHSNQFFLVF